MARPELPVDETLLESLARIHCTYKEMAAILNVSVDTLERRYAELIEKAREQGKMSLRRMQFEAAKKGNTAMLIWLGKQILDQREKIDQTNTHVIERIKEVEALPAEEKKRRLLAALKGLEEAKDVTPKKDE